VIGKVCRRGSDTRRLLAYLFLEGSAGERGLASDHRDAHVIAGYDHPAVLEPARGASGRAEVSRLAALLDAPVRAAGVGKDAKPVYHLAISAAPADRTLSDDEWADIAAPYLHRIGLAKQGDSEAVRWVAVRHADNHIHVVATLVRQDGRRVFPHHDFYRARQASLAVERQYRLTSTSPVERTADPETTRGERRKHLDTVRARIEDGRSVPAAPDREVLRASVRVALAGSQGWEELAERLRGAGVMVRERYSTLHPGQLTGYAVALPLGGPETSSRDQLIWFGGGKLAPDLSLPQLQARWHAGGGNAAIAASGHAHDRAGRSGKPPDRGDWQAGPGLSDLERRRLWSSAQDAVRQAAEQIRHASTPGAGPAEQAGAQAAATATSELLHAVSRILEGRHGGPLRSAADAYDRAARDLHRRTVPTTARGRATRSAAGALLSARLVRRAETRQLLALLAHLTAPSESLARLRETQGRAAQAQAARRAAEQLTVEHAWRAAGASAAAPASKARAPFVRLPTTSVVRPSRQQDRPASTSR
jgi:hypothetical protein